VSGSLWLFMGVVIGFGLAEYLDRDLHR